MGQKTSKAGKYRREDVDGLASDDRLDSSVESDVNGSVFPQLEYGLSFTKFGQRMCSAPHAAYASTRGKIQSRRHFLRDRFNRKSSSSHDEAPVDTSSNQPSSPEGTISRERFIKENSAVLTNLYELDPKKLGTGTYGSVTRGVNLSTGQVRAVKSVPKNSVKNVERFRNEISIMKSLDHPNIVKLFETFEDDRNIYLCMELCQGGELFDRIIEVGRFTEKDAAIYMKQIFSGVHYLHSNRIMHRDLKPENFLFLDRFEDTLKIIDFGLSCRFGPAQPPCTTKAGTPYYVAPQVLAGRYDKACDYWSCGVIMYILLCGYPPFYGETDQDVLAKVKSGKFKLQGPEWKRVSDDTKDLITRLLDYSPETRLTAEQALQHAWIRNLSADCTPWVPLPNTLMSNLRGFRDQNKLKKAALTVIASHLAEKEVENLKQIFMTLDTDHSGTLSLEEVTEGLKRLGWAEIPHDLQSIMQEVDSDGSGFVDYTEFIAATIDRKLYLRKDMLWAAFRVFDLDGNGKISREELIQLIVSTAEIESSSDVDVVVQQQQYESTISRVLRDADLDGDGEIDFDEFTEMMRRGGGAPHEHTGRNRVTTPSCQSLEGERGMIGSCDPTSSRRKLPEVSRSFTLRSRLSSKSWRRRAPEPSAAHLLPRRRAAAAGGSYGMTAPQPPPSARPPCASKPDSQA